jgi:hypothetical protein
MYHLRCKYELFSIPSCLKSMQSKRTTDNNFKPSSPACLVCACVLVEPSSSVWLEQYMSVLVTSDFSLLMKENCLISLDMICVFSRLSFFTRQLLVLAVSYRRILYMRFLTKRLADFTEWTEINTSYGQKYISKANSILSSIRNCRVKLTTYK